MLSCSGEDVVSRFTFRRPSPKIGDGLVYKVSLVLPRAQRFLHQAPGPLSENCCHVEEEPHDGAQPRPRCSLLRHAQPRGPPSSLSRLPPSVMEGEGNPDQICAGLAYRVALGASRPSEGGAEEERERPRRGEAEPGQSSLPPPRAKVWGCTTRPPASFCCVAVL